MAPAHRQCAEFHNREFVLTHNSQQNQLVACVRVVPQKDRLLTEAADEIQRLTDELRVADELRERLGDLLRRTAVALRGPEPPLTRWSWHDVPDRAAAAVAAMDVMQRAASLATARDAYRRRLDCRQGGGSIYGNNRTLAC